jgi:hypothetical protein
MAYVYRHIRLDKNEPFYIGIGSDCTFHRAFEKSRRTQLWNKIVSKTSYEVEILFDDLTWEQACKKEIEFIALYGRMDKNAGTLVNLTDGGEGALGRTYKMKEETKAKLSKSHIGLYHSEETRKKLSKALKGRVFTKEHLNNLKISAQKRDYKLQGQKCADKILYTMNVKPFLVYKGDTFIGEFISRRKCITEIGVSKTMLYEMLKNENKVCKGYQIKMK